ncbi:MAG: hypothetical protein JO197_21075 [Acidobacteria bacterium]|nr:hypothetical protein [Acidobacteriota bacterium]MBV9476866.1 hypothetical protein [Acidobacteriota bacterium]
MDFDKVFAFIDAMNREGVDYITFGAVALCFQGVVRASTDADFFIRPERTNIERLKRALRCVWDDPHVDEICADDLIGDYPLIAYGPPGETFNVDFLTRLDDITYDSLSSELIEYEGIAIRVATAAKLYELKSNSVRLHDKADALRLRAKYPWLEGDAGL